LGDYGGDFDVGLGEEVDEGWDGEVGGAAEEEAHGVSRRRTLALINQQEHTAESETPCKMRTKIEIP